MGADAVIVELIRPDKDVRGVLVCVTEAVVVLDARDDLVTVVECLVLFVGISLRDKVGEAVDDFDSKELFEFVIVNVYNGVEVIKTVEVLFGDTLFLIEFVSLLVAVFRIDAVLEIDGVSVRVKRDERDSVTVPVIVLHALEEPVILVVDVVVKLTLEERVRVTDDVDVLLGLILIVGVKVYFILCDI